MATAKMQDFETRFGKAIENYFTDPEKDANGSTDLTISARMLGKITRAIIVYSITRIK